MKKPEVRIRCTAVAAGVLALTTATSIGTAMASPEAGPTNPSSQSTNTRSHAPVDTDEKRATPVEHRYLHGTLGDASYQIALPDQWNGKFLISSRGFSGTEFSQDDVQKDIALRNGYAYAASDEGWSRGTICQRPQDSFFESKRALLQLTRHAIAEMRSHYGQEPKRVYISGNSNGGHHTKWMLEEFPELFDGGVSMYGPNTFGPLFGEGFTSFLRNLDVVEDRLPDIISARQSDPDWNPKTDPLSPPLEQNEIDALEQIYNIPSHMPKAGNGFTFNTGQEPGSEPFWVRNSGPMMAYLDDTLCALDPTYAPDGPGTLTEAEIKSYSFYESPRRVQNELGKQDLTGDLGRPLIVGHGLDDVLVPANTARAYERLVNEVRGEEGADEVLRTYLIPELGHGGALVNPFVEDALKELDAWVDYEESNGSTGSLPGEVMGLQPIE